MIVQSEFCKIIGVVWRKVCFLTVYMGNPDLHIDELRYVADRRRMDYNHWAYSDGARRNALKRQADVAMQTRLAAAAERP